MQRLRSITTLACVFTCLSLNASTATDNADTRQALIDHPDVKGAIAITDAWIEALQSYAQIPAISVGFVHDQQPIFSRGYGFANLKRKRAATVDTIYSICSISKLFTSIGVMQLRDQGKLNLHDPVAQHLAWFNIKQAHSSAGPTRIEGLLTHSSGLPRESDFPYWSTPEHPFPTRAEMLAKLAEQSTLYPADSLFQYSNLGLTLAGELVRQHSGDSFENYVRQHILQPLEMHDTRPEFPAALHGKQMAIGYSGLDRSLKRHPVKPFHTRAIAPAAGFTSTVNDLMTFASWNFRTLGGEENPVLAGNTLREMQRVHWVDPDWKVTWGLGFAVRKSKDGNQVGHGGACPGYITSLQMVPKHKTAAIALTNAGDGPADSITTAMLKTIGAAVSKAARQKNKPTEDTDQSLDLTPYAGNYGGSVWGGETLIRVWGDQLAVTRVPRDKLEVTKLKHVADHTFVRLTDSDEEREHWYFQLGDQGEITAVKIHGSVISKLP